MWLRKKDLLLNFAKASIGICNKVLCKILRSPLQTVHRTVCLTLGSNPSVKLRATKKQHPMGAVRNGEEGFEFSAGATGSGPVGSDSPPDCHSLPTGSNPASLRRQKQRTPNGVLCFWLRKKDLNPHKQSQSLPCCHYTIPQYSVFRAPRLRLYHYNRQVSSCQLLFRKFLNFFAIIFRHDLSIRHPKIFYVIFS